MIHNVHKAYPSLEQDNQQQFSLLLPVFIDKIKEIVDNNNDNCWEEEEDCFNRL